MPTSPALGAWSRPHRHPVFRLGVILGVFLSGVAWAWLLVANRAPSLESFAAERNLAVALAFGLLMLVPVCRFLKSPGRIFLSGIVAWIILTASYSAMEARFPGLEARLGAFHLFMLGGAVFGLLAAFAWVMRLVLGVRQLRQQPAVVVRRRLP